MASFRDALNNFVRTAFCDAMSIQNLLYDTTGMYAYDILGIRQRMSTAYRLYCNREPPQLPTSPFTGGQCADKKYVVSWFWHAKNLFGNPFNYDATTPPLQGAIGALTSTPDPNAPGGYLVQIPYNIGNGNTLYYNAASTGNSQAPFTNISYGISSVATSDGSPDTCGNPPAPDLPQPTPSERTFPVSFTYVDNSNNSINVSGNVFFSPIVIAGNGLIYAPIRLNLNLNPTIKIDALVRLDTGDININFGDSTKLHPIDGDNKVDPTLPPTVPDPSSDVPTGSAKPHNPDQPQPKTERVMLGCLVDVSSYPSSQSIIYQQTIPNIANARFGNVSFLCSVSGKLGWTEDIPVRNKRQFIACPWPGGAVRVEGSPNAGVVWTIYPVYANRAPEIKFE